MKKLWFKRILYVGGFLVLSAAAILERHRQEPAATVSTYVEQEADAQGRKWKVCLDAGHGGSDPGKVGINQALEKNINLEIVLKLRKFLEAADVEVVLTRETDKGLYDENANNKKVQDMKNRVRKIEENMPDLVISIHQNSYHEEYVHGAQVFYYATSAEGRQAAETMQEQLRRTLEPGNKRVAKANDSYYLLKKTSAPIIIVECGFLSSSAEAAKLIDDAYQEKAAWAIHLGILQYLNALPKSGR